eukprot:780211-Rhodomonas_salina.1
MLQEGRALRELLADFVAERVGSDCALHNEARGRSEDPGKKEQEREDACVQNRWLQNETETPSQVPSLASSSEAAPAPFSTPVHVRYPPPFGTTVHFWPSQQHENAQIGRRCSVNVADVGGGAVVGVGGAHEVHELVEVDHLRGGELSGRKEREGGGDIKKRGGRDQGRERLRRRRDQGGGGRGQGGGEIEKGERSGRREMRRDREEGARRREAREEERCQGGERLKRRDGG